MKISTKTGDRGKTSILYGGRVKKSCLRIEVCGILDELNSFLGLSKSLSKDIATKRSINTIQRDIFTITSEAACAKSSAHKLKKKIGEKNIKALESSIEKLEKKNRSGRSSLSIPGKNTLSATLDVSRTVARRAERRIVAMKDKGMLKNNDILIYLNRLSDLLYLLARKK